LGISAEAEIDLDELTLVPNDILLSAAMV
jgi:hypothetical protein